MGGGGAEAKGRQAVVAIEYVTVWFRWEVMGFWLDLRWDAGADLMKWAPI